MSENINWRIKSSLWNTLKNAGAEQIHVEPGLVALKSSTGNYRSFCDKCKSLLTLIPLDSEEAAIQEGRDKLPNHLKTCG